MRETDPLKATEKAINIVDRQLKQLGRAGWWNDEFSKVEESGARQQLISIVVSELMENGLVLPFEK